jgi:hypothetical protein
VLTENLGGGCTCDPEFGGGLHVHDGERFADPLFTGRIVRKRVAGVPGLTGAVGTAGGFGERHVLGLFAAGGDSFGSFAFLGPHREREPGLWDDPDSYYDD